jgi:putative transcriptional regulator
VQNSIRDRRSQRDLSQGSLANAMDVSRQTINAIETGRHLPSLPLAIGLARFFETTVEDLFPPEPGTTSRGAAATPSTVLSRRS